MKERPILFSGPMVLAILAGKKTQTRRQVKLREFQSSTTRGYDWTFRDRRALWNDVSAERLMELCPYGQPGDRLWVRETWGYRGAMWWGGKPDEIKATVEYQADLARMQYTRPHRVGEVGIEGMPRQRCGKDCDGDPGGIHGDELRRYWRSWRPSIHMPRWASRIDLEVTNVRVERLQAISAEDARAEGVEKAPSHRVYPSKHAAVVSTHTAGFEALWDRINGNWAANPWVWVVSFNLVSKEAA